MPTTAAELIVKVSADTAGAEGDLRSFSSRMLSGAGGMGAVFGGTLLTAGVMGVGRAVGGLARGVVGLGADAVSAGADFAYSMDQVAAVLGATDAEAAQLAQTAVSLGMNPNLKVSTEEAADAMYSLATAGLTTQQIVGGAAEATVLLANATGGDMAQAGQVATDAMALWGMSADQLGESINGVVGVSNASKFDLNDYALALAQGGGVAAMAGMSFNDFNASIAATSSYFSSGSDAGTSMKTMLAQLTPTTTKAEEAMFALGLITEDGSNQFYDAEGNLRGMYDIVGLLNGATKDLTEEQRKVALQTIFGNDAMRSAGALAGMTADEYEAMYMVVNEGTSALGQAKIRTDNLRSSWETFKDTIDAAKTDFGLKLEAPLQMIVKAITPMVDVLAEFVQPYIDEASKWLETNIPILQARAPIAFEAWNAAPGLISGLAAAYGELSGKGGELAPVVADLSAMDAALKAFNTTGANPFPALFAGIAAAIAGGTAEFDAATGTFTTKWKAFEVEMSKTGEIEIHPNYKFIDDSMGSMGIVQKVNELGNSLRAKLGQKPISVDQPMTIKPIWSDTEYEPFDINKWIMSKLGGAPYAWKPKVNVDPEFTPLKDINSALSTWFATQSAVVTAVFNVGVEIAEGAVEWGGWTHIYDVMAWVRELPIWGSYTNTYGVGAEVTSDPAWGVFTHIYDVAAAIKRWIIGTPPTVDVHARLIYDGTAEGAGGGGTGGANASGTASWRGGLSWVGENGPELVALPGGSRVWNNRESMAMAGAGGPQVVINANVSDAIDLEVLARRVGQYLRRG